MSTTLPHITICVCTYQRPVLLRRLLDVVSQQDAHGLFTFSVVIADNDAACSGEKVVAEFVSQNPMKVVYCSETRRNIALARNATVERAQGEYIAFIDDDEFPEKDWLFNMFETCTKNDVSGVLGPVVSHYDFVPPKWVKAGGFYERPRHGTGFKLQWPECRTGNVLFRSAILKDLDQPFREEFGSGGEDQDFFCRLMQKNHRFIWCDEGVVYEVVPESRCKRSFMISRALLRGRNSMRHRSTRVRVLFKSFLAFPLYVLALPVLFVAGHHHFMKYLVKSADHAGRILTVFGANPVKDRPM